MCESCPGFKSAQYYLMNESKVNVEAVSNKGGSLGASGIGGDNDSVAVLRDMSLYIVLDQGLAVEVVDRNVEEALVLGVVEIHGNDMVGASAGQKVGDECASQGNPLLVPGLGLEGGGVGRLLEIVGSEGRLGSVGSFVLVAGAVTTTLAGIGAEAGHGIGSLWREVVAILLCNDAFGELLGKAIDAIRKAMALRAPWTRSSGNTLKCVVLFGSSLQGAGEGSASLVIGPVGLARVREERDDSGDALGRAGFAGGYHDAKLHEVIVDAARARLDDVDILASD